MKLKNRLASEHIDHKFRDSILLKMLAVAQYDIDKAVENCQSHKDFIAKVKSTDLSTEFMKGSIYLSNFDKQFRPLIVIREFINTDLIMHFLELVKQKLLIDYYVESWTILIDLDDDEDNFPTLSIDRLLEFQLHFCGNLNRILVVNCPFDADLVLQPFTDKFKFLKQVLKIIDDLPEILLYVSKNQLEQKYGGDFPDVTHFWPIQSREKVARQGSLLSVNNDLTPRKGSFMKITVLEENGNALMDQNLEVEESHQSNKDHQSNQDPSPKGQESFSILNPSDNPSEIPSDLKFDTMNRDLKETTKAQTYTQKSGRQKQIVFEREVSVDSPGCCSKGCLIF